jgi:hypothetical protein
MKSLALLILLCFSSLSFAFDFFRYGPSPRTINGVSYPRNQMTLYRGTTDGQMDLNKAVRAMFRDSTANVESFFFSTIKHKLMNRSFGAEVALNSTLTSLIKQAISDNGGPLSEKAAVQKTIQLVDGTFEYYGDKNNISRYVNYNSPNWIDWPKDIVFSSIVSPAAATYGDKVIIINEKKPRAIDLNFWNLVHNGKDRDHDRDIGEFSTPGYVLFSDIEGYQVRTGIRGSIIYSLHRVEIRGETYVLVFDGTWNKNTLSKCIVRTDEWNIVHCNYPGGLALSPPPATDKAVAILGVVALCDSKTTCDVPQEIYQHLPTISSKKLASSTQQQIENIDLKGMKTFFVPAE